MYSRGADKVESADLDVYVDHGIDHIGSSAEVGFPVLHVDMESSLSRCLKKTVPCVQEVSTGRVCRVMHIMWEAAKKVHS